MAPGSWCLLAGGAGIGGHGLASTFGQPFHSVARQYFRGRIGWLVFRGRHDFDARLRQPIVGAVGQCQLARPAVWSGVCSDCSSHDWRLAGPFPQHIEPMMACGQRRITRFTGPQRGEFGRWFASFGSGFCRRPGVLSLPSCRSLGLGTGRNSDWPDHRHGLGLTQAVAGASFEPVAVQSLSFSGPSAEWLMRVLSTAHAAHWGFDTGVLPGAFVGSLIGGLLGREFKFEGFKTENKLDHYLSGAILMDFGAVLAGGCTVGAGMTGGAIFALSAWLTFVSIWVGAGMAWRLSQSMGWVV